MELSSSTKQFLQMTGFDDPHEVVAYEKKDFVDSFGLPEEKVEKSMYEIKEIVDRGNEKCFPHGVTTALQLLGPNGVPFKKISTGSIALDKILAGGIGYGLTEICGLPGTGKTQLCMQIAINATIPESFGGIAGEVVYIDCEGSLSKDRVSEIAKAMLAHLTTIASSKETAPEIRQAQATALEKLDSVNKVLDKIHYWRVFDLPNLLVVINNLKQFLEKTPNVKLVIVDSIAFLIRQEMEDSAKRSRIVNNIAQTLQQYCSRNTVATIVTNHMTTQIKSNGDISFIPALGESWAHTLTSRIKLWRTQDGVVGSFKRDYDTMKSQTSYVNSVRMARLVKSPSLKSDQARFLIDNSGIVDETDPLLY